MGRGWEWRAQGVRCFQSGHPKRVTSTSFHVPCTSCRGTTAMQDTLRLHDLHCCVHMDLLCNSHGHLNPSQQVGSWQRMEADPWVPSVLPVSDSSWANAVGRAGLPPTPTNPAQLLGTINGRNGLLPSTEWETPLGKPKPAFERQNPHQPSHFPAHALLQQTGRPGTPENQIILKYTEVIAINIF